MNLEKEKPEMKNCGEGCGCAVEQEVQLKTDQQNLKTAERKEEKKLDPTHFGDWQVNCRTIDF